MAAKMKGGEDILEMAERLVDEKNLAKKLAIAKEFVTLGKDGWAAIFEACAMDEPTASAMRLMMPKLIEEPGAAEALSEALQYAKKHVNAAVRKTAITAAEKLISAIENGKVRLSGTAGEEMIVSAVSDEDEGVAHEALNAAKKLRIKKAAAAAAQIIVSGKSRGLSKGAAAALSAIGGEAQLDALHLMLESENPQDRKLAAIAVGAIGSKSSLAPLEKAWKKDGAELDRLHTEGALMAASIAVSLENGDVDKERMASLISRFTDSIGDDKLRETVARRTERIMGGKDRPLDSEKYNEVVAKLFSIMESYSAIDEARGAIIEKVGKKAQAPSAEEKKRTAQPR